ncbi:tetratricopeptide repeat protein [Cyanobium sp. ATX-6F1]|uniref:tetratricopeptide repeat protein n=1 Tax=Cyanobium sp. ATX-6F1 TaxID=3137388 RepID=UPI0039BE8ABD
MVLADSSPAYRRDLSVSLNNLSQGYSDRGRRAESLSLTEEAVKIDRELVLDGSNPTSRGNLAGSLKRLGFQLAMLNRAAEAQPPMEEAVKIYRELTFSNSALLVSLADSSLQLAGFYLDQQQAIKAEPLLREALGSQVLFLQGQLPLLAEAQRQPLLQTFGEGWLVNYSVAGSGGGGAEVALFTRLNRHGLLQDIERRQALLARAPGPQRALSEQLKGLTARLSDASLGQPERLALQKERDQLEQQLYRQLPALKPRLVEPQDVARALPADGVLVEFQRYRPSFASEYRLSPANQSSDKRSGDPRYLALVLVPDGGISSVDLGPASAIDPLIQQALKESERGELSVSPLWEQVSAKVFGPLLKPLSGRRTWFVSPDGELNRLPFAALPAPAASGPAKPGASGASNLRLVQTIQLHVITSGRELLPSPAAAAGGTPWCWPHRRLVPAGARCRRAPRRGR